MRAVHLLFNETELITTSLFRGKIIVLFVSEFQEQMEIVVYRSPKERCDSEVRG